MDFLFWLKEINVSNVLYEVIVLIILTYDEQVRI